MNWLRALNVLLVLWVASSVFELYELKYGACTRRQMAEGVWLMVVHAFWVFGTAALVTFVAMQCGITSEAVLRWIRFPVLFGGGFLLFPVLKRVI
jgi:heme/copper-type cytochrome/quinol oxidase subunit 1